MPGVLTRTALCEARDETFKTVRAPYHPDLTPKKPAMVLGSRRLRRVVHSSRSALAGGWLNLPLRVVHGPDIPSSPSSNCCVDRKNGPICRKNVAFCATGTGTSRPQLAVGALPAALSADWLQLL